MRVRAASHRRARRAGAGGPRAGRHVDTSPGRATAAPCNADAHTCPSLRAAIAASEATKEVADIDQRPGGHDQHQQRPGDPVGHHGQRRERAHDDHRRRRRSTAASGSRRRGSAKINHLTIRNGAAGQGGSTDGGGILNLSGVVAAQLRARDDSRARRRRRRDRELPGHADAVNGLVDNNTARRRRRHRQPRRRRDARPRPARRRRLDDLQEHGRDRRDGRHQLARRQGERRPARTARRWPTTPAACAASADCSTSAAARPRSSASMIARNLVGAATVNCGARKPTDSGGNVEDDKDLRFDARAA